MNINEDSYLFKLLNEDNESEKKRKGNRGLSEAEILSLNSVSDIKRVEEIDASGIRTSYPNDELKEKQFLIRRKARYLSIPNLHRHAYIEMSYVLSGSYSQTINGQSIEMEKGDLILLDKNTIHSNSYLDENTIAVNLLFTPEFFDGIFLNLFTNSSHISEFIINALYTESKARNYIVFHIEEDSFLKVLLQKLLIEYFHEQRQSSAAMTGYLLILFTELSRLHSNGLNVVNEIKKDHKNKKAEILQYITNHFKDLTLSEIADYFHFHPAYMSSFIKKSFGKNLQDIIIDKRLEYSCSLLKNTNYSIEEIVSETGYSNKSYFYKLFKKAYNITPNQYRKEHAPDQ